mmetsp:Transcript_39481/g.86213  ORF Transcript_39481/g.86213 Transcript_39481/m.86213 type:complete len:215 (-) Transcript_39481:3166-3810(-)
MLLPMAVSLPSAMMAMRSERTSASSMKCVESRTARLFLWRDSSCQMSRRLVASTPAVGSSSATTWEPPAKAMPMESLRFMPPLRDRAGALRFAKSPVSLSKFSTSEATKEGCTDFRLQKSFRCSSTVRASYRALCWRHTPSCCRTAWQSLRTERPPTKTSPSVGGKSPVRMAMVVLFPAPLCPRRPRMVPRCISRLIPLRAVFPLRKLLTSFRI